MGGEGGGGLNIKWIVNKDLTDGRELKRMSEASPFQGEERAGLVPGMSPQPRLHPCALVLDYDLDT